MNISETFIRRPIATSLLMLGLLVFGIGDLRPAAGGGAAQRRFSDHHRSARSFPAPARTPWPRRWRRRSSSSSPPSPASTDDLDQRRSAPPRSRCSSTSAATSTAPPATCRRRSTPPSGLLPKDLPNPPTYKKINPADRADADLRGARPTHLPIYKVDDYAYTILAQKLSTRHRRLAGRSSPASRTMPSVSRSTRWRSPRAASGSRTSAPRSPPRPSTGRRATLEGTQQTLTLDTNDQLFNADAYNNVIVAYRNGAPVRVQDVGHGRSTRRRTPRTAPGTTTSAPRCC